MWKEREEMPNVNEKYILQSVSNALDILDLLSERKEMSVPEIAEATGFGKSSVFRLLATLESKSYVRKSEDARYSLDIKLVSMGQAAMNQNEIIRYGHPYLETLTHASGETSHLAMLFQTIYCRFVDKVVSTSTIHMDSHPGFYRPAHYMACGKVMLSNSSRVVQEHYIKSVNFERLTEYSIQSGEQLLKELEKIKAQGYAMDHEESEYGLTCVAAPIMDNAGQVIAAVSISGPTWRMKEHVEKNISLVTEAGRAISREISEQIMR